MKLLRYAGALALTVLLLMVSRHLSMVRPMAINTSGDGVALFHTTVPKIVDGKPDRISLKISNPENRNIHPLLYWLMADDFKAGKKAYNAIIMISDTTNIYYAPMPLLPKGKIIYYYVEIALAEGGRIATIPENIEKPIKLKYEAPVPPYIVIPHIFLMFVAIFLASLAMFDALRMATDPGRLLPLARNFRWATIAIFLGGYPFGWAMNHYAFGTVWEGIPFGWDFTDNKTQIVFLYSVFLNLSMLGTLYNGRFGPNNFSDRTLRWLTLLGYILVMAIYIIPHSIQFSIPVTAIFAYGLTALIVALYVYGVTRKHGT